MLIQLLGSLLPDFDGRRKHAKYNEDYFEFLQLDVKEN